MAATRITVGSSSHQLSLPASWELSARTEWVMSSSRSAPVRSTR